MCVCINFTNIHVPKLALVLENLITAMISTNNPRRFNVDIYIETKS